MQSTLAILNRHILAVVVVVAALGCASVAHAQPYYGPPPGWVGHHYFWHGHHWHHREWAYDRYHHRYWRYR